MADRDDADVRSALVEAADWTVAVVAGIGDDQWDEPGLGEWDVRSLTAHTSRGLSIIERYLSQTEPGSRATINSPEEYFRTAFAVPDVHAAVAARGRDEAGVLGDDPASYMVDTRDRVLAIVAATPEGSPCNTIIGVMRLEDYLVTRIAELVLHTIDLAAATGQPITPPGRPARLVLRLLGELTPDDRLADVLAGLTGRRGLPEGFDILGFGPGT